MMIKKQRSLCTLSSYTLSDWQPPSMGTTVDYENLPYQNSLWPQFLTLDSDQIDTPYQSSFLYDYSAAGDMPYPNFHFQSTEDSQPTEEESFLTYGDPWNPPEVYQLPEQPFSESYTLPIEDGTQSYFDEPFQQQILQYGSPTVTDYGAVALLLRHLIRVDMTPDGSVSIYNFPGLSVTTLNADGSKCYIKHPNGLVFQEKSMIHIMTGNGRMVKMSRRGIYFSSIHQSLAYLVDESGTKTTTGKFTNLSQDLTMDVFYDGVLQNHESMGDCYKMASEATYQSFHDGSELWNFGKIRIKQDRWGEVTVYRNDKSIVIATSPTIRRVTIESPLVNINIDCFLRNYLTVKKDGCVVTSAYCGLIAQNGSQKAGLDRFGKLVLF